MSAPVLALGDISFYWRMLERPEQSDGSTPAFLPFAFSFDPALQLVIQKRDPLVLDWLKKVYEADANVGYLQEGHALAEKYGNDFLGFIDRSLQRGGAARSALEVGCGGGYILERLAGRGLTVAGVDPSPVAARRAAKVGLRIIPDFYPSATLDETFDLIFHYDVLEHVEDPAAFLRAHARNLAPGGQIVIAVPDCTESIARGDISMLIHEHLNYFDEEALRRTIERAGFEAVTVERSGYGNVLYGLARKLERPAAPAAAGGARKFEAFRDRVETARQRFRDFVEPHLGDVGLYVPLRLIPYLSTLSRRTGFRFFDDDPGLRGKYFEGYAVPVESFDDFLRATPGHVVVGSFAFAEAIAKRIRERVSRPVQVIGLRDFAA